MTSTQMVYNPTAKVGGILDTVIGGSFNLAPQLINLFGGGTSSSSAQAKGLKEITAQSNQVLALLDSINAQIGQANFQQLYAQATQLVASLSDPTFFFQAKKGKDAAVLQNAKISANQKLQAIAAKAAQINAGDAISNQAGQVTVAGGTFLQNLLNDKTTIYLIAGIALVVLLRRD